VAGAPGDSAHAATRDARYSIYLVYWYKSTSTDAPLAATAES
jgi:hypothetical protein